MVSLWYSGPQPGWSHQHRFHACNAASTVCLSRPKLCVRADPSSSRCELNQGLKSKVISLHGHGNTLLNAVDMNFPTSTHKKDWLFDAESLTQKYATAQQQALESLRAAIEDTPAAEVAAPDAKKQRADCPISSEDEAQLKLYYQVKLKAICQQQQLPSKVLNAALLFFKRFYVNASCLEHDPLRVMPTCIYLACKVEEAYRSAESLCKALGIEANPVLRFEVPLLQGLKFDLVVHSPYRALAGLFKEFEDLRDQQSSMLDAQLLAAPAQTLSAAHSKARAAVDLLVMTDAPLLFAPGVLAVAAFRSGFRGVQLGSHNFLRHIAHRAMQSADGASAASPEEAEQQLLTQLAAVDEIARNAQIDEALLQSKAAEVDRTIKLWKKRMAAQQRSDSKGATPPPGAVVAVN